ncbi:MAG: helix-turn-helix domain-containing protein [Suipraeoptans sp.]
MVNSQIGNLIFKLRLEKQMTQRQLAEKLGITEQAVSKWERGLGSPDISLLSDLSQILGVNIDKMLAGDLQPNDIDGGNMKRIKFYVCPECGGVLTSTGEAEISCCGRKLNRLIAKTADEEHRLVVDKVENDYYITCSHEMTKNHYISFIAYVTIDKLLLTKLYPEQNAEIRIPQIHGGKIYYYCTQHGLMETGV